MLENLFSPCKIGNLTLPNRLLVSSMVNNYVDEECKPTERSVAYYEARAKGGWGLIMTETIAVVSRGRSFTACAGIWDDSFIPRWQKVVEATHKHGTLIFAQLQHAGRQAESIGMLSEAPTAIPCPRQPEIVPEAMTKEGIKNLVEAYGDAALRAKKAGFDGIEIHAGHGYLLSAFMNFYANKRIDEYGGCLENRMRIVKELMENIREKTGRDFPVSIRIAIDYAPGGNTIGDIKAIAYYLEKECMVDAIAVSVGTRGIAPDSTRPMYHARAWMVPNAEEVKKVVNIPVITLSNINDPILADSIIASGAADLIAMARPSLADPEFPNKAKAGKLDNIRQCIRCVQGCSGSLFERIPIECLVNPSSGHESEDDLSKVKEPKNVVVIGGGPAGMEAARAAALRGHRVDLYEEKDELGGNFRIAAYPPGKGEFITYTRWITHTIRDLGVNIHLGEKMDAEKIKAMNPDAVVVAVGGDVARPPIPGIDGKNVVTAEDILLSKALPGNNIVIAGGGSVGAETAVFLGVERNKNVTVVEMLPEIASNEGADSRGYLMELLDRFHIKTMVNTKIQKFTEESVTVEAGGATQELPCDTIVLAFGYRPTSALYHELTEMGIPTQLVGDAKKVSNAWKAIRAGYAAGLSIE